MPAPLTQTQIAEKSILDLNGRQNYLGNAFTTNIIYPIATGTPGQVPLVLIKNPAGSGKSLFFIQSILNSDNSYMFFFIYKNPTITSVGTALTVSNLRIGATTTSISQCYSSPTIANNGTQLSGFTNYSSQIVTYPFILDPGTNLLINTGLAIDYGNTNVFITENWYEI